MRRIFRGLLWLTCVLSLAFAVKTGGYDRRFLGLLLASTAGVLLLITAGRGWRPVTLASLFFILLTSPFWIQGPMGEDVGFGIANRIAAPLVFATLAAVAAVGNPYGVGMALAGALCALPALGYLTHPNFATANLLGLSSPYSALLAVTFVSFLAVLLLRRIGNAPLKRWRAIAFAISGLAIGAGAIWLVDLGIVRSRLM